MKYTGLFDMTKLSRTLLMVFAALGLGAASTSSYVHYHLLTDPSYSSFCDINATVNCTQASYRFPGRTMVPS